MTETAKQRQEMHKSFLSILEKEQIRDMRPDDEIDSTFFGYANRMRLHLNQDQKEDVLQEIKVVTQAINNVCASLPAINGTPMYVPPAPPLQQATTSLVQQLGPGPGQEMGNPQQGPPPMQQMVNTSQPPPMQQMGHQQQQYEFTYTPIR